MPYRKNTVEQSSMACEACSANPNLANRLDRLGRRQTGRNQTADTDTDR